MNEAAHTTSDAVTSAEGSGPTVESLFLGPGDVIGPYTLTRVLGEGGFGIVFEAERTHPIRQTVALKILKPGMDSRAVLGRFEQERRSLAVMDHPNLARVLDAGQTARGLPYFVMELVRGQPITEFCDQRQLSIRERLELFIPVCEAVHHAHMKGIIHRDLKPANILVAGHDEISTPKVIDFGIAKALGADELGRTMVTEAGQLVGTPEYMSPEQADASADVDTRTDVYSLGVVLYEILVGALPFDSDAIRSGGFLAIQRAIRELPTPRASTRLFAQGASSGEIAKRRSVTLRDLHRILKTELEWIPLKAMSKERDRRYVSAHALAEDLRAYLAGQPLVAGPESTAYRARKFLARNRLAAIAASIILLSILAGLAGTAFGLVRAQQHAREEAAARAKAEDRLKDVRRLANSLLFDLNSDIERLPGSTGVRKRLVDIGLSYLDKLAREDSSDPALFAELASGYYRLAEVQSGGRAGNVGDRPGALASHDKALAIRQSLLAKDPASASLVEAVTNSQISRSHLLRQLGMHKEAHTAAETGLRHARARVASDPSRENRRMLSRALTALAWSLWSLERTDESGAFSREALLLDQALVDEDPDDWKSRSNLATGHSDMADLHERAGRVELARSEHELAIEIYRSIRDRDPSNTEHMLSLAAQLRKLASVLNDADNSNDAIELLNESLALSEPIARSDPSNAMAHSSIRAALSELADALDQKRDFAGSLEARRRTRDMIQSRVTGSPDDVSLREDFSAAQSEIVTTLVHLDRLPEAESLARETLALDREILATSPTPARREYVAFSLRSLGDVLTRLGKFDEAHVALSESLEIRSDLLRAEPDSERRMSKVSAALQDIGLLCRERGDTAGAVSHLRQSAEIDERLALLQPQDASRHGDSLSSLELLANALGANGEYSEALTILNRCVGERRTTIGSSIERANLADALAWRAAVLAHDPSDTDALAKARKDLVEATQIFAAPEVASVISKKMAGRAAAAQALLDRLGPP